MSLSSEDNDKAFEEITQTLINDETFTRNVSSLDQKFSPRRSLAITIIFAASGLFVTTLSLGNLTGIGQIIGGVLGFVLMVVGGFLFCPDPKFLVGTNNAPTKTKSAYMKNLEEKWDKRREENRREEGRA